MKQKITFPVRHGGRLRALEVDENSFTIQWRKADGVTEHKQRFVSKLFYPDFSFIVDDLEGIGAGGIFDGRPNFGVLQLRFREAVKAEVFAPQIIEFLHRNEDLSNQNLCALKSRFQSDNNSETNSGTASPAEPTRA